MTILPVAPDQTIAQMWSNGVWGGSVEYIYTVLQLEHYLKQTSEKTLSVYKQLKLSVLLNW